jgi:uncharacterized protein YqjF (DUF2071 family)
VNITAESESLSAAARGRMRQTPGEPLFYASWDHAVMIHYEADPDALQKCVPFALDLRDGRAFVSLVAFTLRRMRPRRGGRVGEWLLKPIATHEFLNVRTYVRANDEPGIFFLAEWLSNRLSVPLGPPVFGLPYRYGRIHFRHRQPNQEIYGRVEAKGSCLAYRGLTMAAEFAPCDPGSLTEFLMERYTAFTQPWRRRHRLFRVWHEPWPQTPVDVEITASNLIAVTGKWWNTAEYIGANYSPGVDVWMGRPHPLPN